MWFRTCTVAATILLTAGAARATDALKAQVPNSGQFDCNLCHTAGPGSALNAFGNRVSATRTDPDTIDWSAVFNADCDQDGYTNGEELGDPDGDQVADPSFAATHPYDNNDFPCGNGTVEGPELCDGADLNGETCSTVADGDGTLACAANCRTWDTTDCAGAVGVCGDGVLDPGEACDDGGDNALLPGACRPTCTLPRCGDGVVDPGETCEPGLSADCTSACAIDTCGDGVLDPGEGCDDGEANSRAPDACRPTCSPASCGDGIVDSGEECEPATGGGACTAQCIWNRCPDGTINANGYCGDGPARAGEVKGVDRVAPMVGSSFGCTAAPPGAVWLVVLAVVRRRRHSARRLA